MRIPASLELEAGLAGRLGQRLHAAVVEETVAVEDDLLDLPRARDLRDRPPHAPRRLDVAARRATLAHARRRLREAGGRAPGLAVDELRVDVLAAAVARDPRPVAARDPPHPPGLSRPVPPLLLVSDLAPHDRPQAPAPALPTLRRTCSPRYRMPLPLYGSGGRIARRSAANW